MRARTLAVVVVAAAGALGCARHSTSAAEPVVTLAVPDRSS